MSGSFSRNKILTITLIFAYYLAFGFPFQATTFASEQKETSHNAQATQSIALKVIEPKVFTQIKSSAQTQGVLGIDDCRSMVKSVNDSLQNTAAINLNQPANCFSLEVSHWSSFVRELTVAPLAQQLAKIIVVSAPLLSAPAISQAPVSSKNPVLPLVVTLSIVFLVWERKMLVQSLRTSVVQIKQNLTLQELQMLRC